MILLWLLGTCLSWADVPRHDLMPRDDIDGHLSSNWIAAVKTALPAKYFAQGDLSFQQTTNLLREESQHGNNAAQFLWAFVLLSRSQSQQQTTADLALLRGSADKGYVPAMYQLGLLYEYGKYVGLDHDQAFRWIKMAADKGSSEAQIQLGGCYHYGLGTAKDPAMAVKCYRRAADQTNYVAMKCLGYVLVEGIGTKRDVEEATYWFTRAANEGGNRRAMYNLGVISARKSDTNSMAEAFKWFQQSADLGDPLACAQVASYYYFGMGVVKTNLENYRHWLLRAANCGDTQSQFIMGQACRIGEGVPVDVAASLDWYRKAAARNHPGALYDLAVYYLQDKTNRTSILRAHDYMLRAARAGELEAQFQCALSCFRGDVTNSDCEEGIRWWTRAAENGWGKAAYNLFQLYYYGASPFPGCPRSVKDAAQGVKWLNAAANQGVVEAQSSLGILLIQGKIVDADKTKAEKLLRNAAEHGYAKAQNDLGFAILRGDVGDTNVVESAMWCKLAEAGSSDPDLLRRIAVNLTNALSRLTAEQQLEVDRRTKAFRVLPQAAVDPYEKDWEKNPAYEREDPITGH